MSDPQPRTPHPQQKALLAAAGGLLAVALVLVLVVVLTGGSDGPAPGSPDALTDRFASALRAHDPNSVAALSCRSARRSVAHATRPVLDSITAAQRVGSAKLFSDIALARITVAGSVPAGEIATVSFRMVRRSWCVAGFAMAAPAHR